MTSISKKLFNWHTSLLIFFISLAGSVHAQWVRIDTSGIVTCFAGDGEYIYAGFKGGYYYPGNTAAARNIIRSSDNGITWENVSNGLTSGSIYSLDVRRLSVAGNKILAGTMNGIFISSNQGNSWTQSNFDPGHGEVFAFLVIDSLIFAGTDAGDFMPEWGGIFLSNDGGQSWVRSDSGLENNLYNYRVKAFAKIGSIIFAGTYGNGIFYSNDTGKSWIRPAARGILHIPLR